MVVLACEANNRMWDKQQHHLRLGNSRDMDAQSMKVKI
jgi:hypothetical protein